MFGAFVKNTIECLQLKCSSNQGDETAKNLKTKICYLHIFEIELC